MSELNFGVKGFICISKKGIYFEEFFVSFNKFKWGLFIL